jgi:hypothetical protein
VGVADLQGIVDGPEEPRGQVAVIRALDRLQDREGGLDRRAVLVDGGGDDRIIRC